jgi:hypothetical protein
MTHKEFFASVEGYFGKYPRTFMRNEMGAYVKTIPEDELAYLYSYMKYSLSTRFNVAPDVEAIEKARTEIYVAGKNTIKPHIKQLPDPMTRGQTLIPAPLWKKITDAAKRKNAEKAKEEAK